ncbi:hypothetical protein G6F46_000974 [Rhizopus delemar]|uniref:DUSP domain-containing protein n=2 Tax=Rhizopus TaxID=4842 RepID=A0A9P7CS01_9FUNG|nr:hypothetical protein G6F55_000404 [Rhizopus delemar]KAG1545332.1 hypothetical protein G6F51_005532 [Rhizopus arrhizus]KAG1505320.1 hypothetical protein G6F54_000385 [Rhizopus delemar]KAG1518323.1 hypothetical protein G6F53_000670 [Rhizopus delemar]KAG1520834.1 hypothetical protein G6F52_007298 [Rhizopus delemar]
MYLRDYHEVRFKERRRGNTELTRTARFVVKPQNEYAQKRKPPAIESEKILFESEPIVQPSASEYRRKKENPFIIKPRYNAAQQALTLKSKDEQKIISETKTRYESIIPSKRSFDTVEQDIQSELSQMDKGDEPVSERYLSLQHETTNQQFGRIPQTEDERQLIEDDVRKDGLLYMDSASYSEDTQILVNMQHKASALQPEMNHTNTEEDETMYETKAEKAETKPTETEQEEAEHEIGAGKIEHGAGTIEMETEHEHMEAEKVIEKMEIENESIAQEEENEETLSIRDSPSLHFMSDVSDIMMETYDISLTNMTVTSQEPNKDTQEIVTEIQHNAISEKETSVQPEPIQRVEELRKSKSPSVISHAENIQSIDDRVNQDIQMEKEKNAQSPVNNTQPTDHFEKTSADYNFENMEDNYGYDGAELLEGDVQGFIEEEAPAIEPSKRPSGASYRSGDSVLESNEDVDNAGYTNQIVKSEKEQELDKIINELKSSIRSTNQTRAMKLRDIQTEIFNSVIVKIVKEEQKNTTNPIARRTISEFYDRLSESLNHQQKLFKEYQGVSINKQRLNKIASKYKMELLDIQKKRHQVRRKIEEQKETFQKMDEKANVLSSLDDFFSGIKSLRNRIMFTNKQKIEKFNADTILRLTTFLDLSSILQLTLTSKSFCHLMKDEFVFKRLVERDFGITDKNPEESWVKYYKHLKAEKKNQQVKNGNDCPHWLDYPEGTAALLLEIKKILYKSQTQNPSLCHLCQTQPATFLNMHPACHSEACRGCLDKFVDDEEHYSIQLELDTGKLYCFKCEDNQAHRIDETEKGSEILKILNAPSSEQELDLRRKAEHLLYIQELRREEMSLKHYFVEKQWSRMWMLFRTREGSPLPGRITNSKLARNSGTLDPNIRLPMDKYRPSPETHADIISVKLWNYLAKAYGVQGKAYNEDDIVAPEYARLRVYVDDFKKSINLYP